MTRNVLNVLPNCSWILPNHIKISTIIHEACQIALNCLQSHIEFHKSVTNYCNECQGIKAMLNQPNPSSSIMMMQQKGKRLQASSGSKLRGRPDSSAPLHLSTTSWASSKIWKMCLSPKTGSKSYCQFPSVCCSWHTLPCPQVWGVFGTCIPGTLHILLHIGEKANVQHRMCNGTAGTGHQPSIPSSTSSSFSSYQALYLLHVTSLPISK